MDNAGFYKLDGDELLFAPYGVTSLEYDLQPDMHATYSYPVDGWQWFDSEEEAREAYQIQEKG